MSQRSGAAPLGQVDDDIARFIMGHSRILAALAPRAEREAEFAIQGDRLRRHAKDAGEVKQSIIGLVQILAAASVLDIIAELNPAEPECFGELLRRDVGAVAMVVPDARRISGASNIGNVLELVEHFDELGAILAQIFSGLLGGVERLEVGICPADLLAADDA